MRILGVAAAALLLATADVALSQQPEFHVVVNAENPITRLTTEELTELFLDRSSRWPHGPAVSAVDQQAKSAIREVFTRRVMGRTVDSVVTHWKERMMREREPPPPVKGSDSDVIEYVTKNKNAVGYVAPGTNLPPAVKQIVVAE